MNGGVIQFILGPLHGEIRQVEDLSPVINIPYVTRLPSWFDGKAAMQIVPSVIVYRRIGDTLNYICVSEPKE